MEQLAVRMFACPKCHAAPGVVCVTSSGADAEWMHSGRTKPLRDTWQNGYESGVRDADAKWLRRREGR